MSIDDGIFEQEVARIARALWPDCSGGALMISGRERDGVYTSEDCVHIIECTVSRRKDKAIYDAKKIFDLISKLRLKNPTKAIKGWFITKHDPTAEQRTEISKISKDIAPCSYDSFRSRIIDAATYLETRINYKFGSHAEEDGKAEETYIERDICDKNGDRYSVNTITEHLCSGKVILILGDYGAGKSTTIKALFLSLRKQYLAKTKLSFPIALNLRDHHGQSNPAEVLERHARNIGFSNPSHLVRAWRAGFISLMLDGFDELGASGWIGKLKKLKDLRYNSVQLIRNFIRESPRGAGIVISGRQHYFDTEQELINALGISKDDLFLYLNDFTEDQVKSYLEKKGWSGAVPSWFPSRPLLLGYLASKSFLADAISIGSNVTPAAGWDILLDKISNREAGIEAGIDGSTVRRIIERLASKARFDPQGLGPLTQEKIIESFVAECGYYPDDKGLVLLQRLPGLGAFDPEEGSRQFVDSDFVDAARAGDVFYYIKNPFTFPISEYKDWQHSIESLGQDIIANKCSKGKFSAKKMSVALSKAGSERLNCLAGDIFSVLIGCGHDYVESQVVIEDVQLHEISFLSDANGYDQVIFSCCIINELEVTADIKPNNIAKFQDCYISTLAGISNKSLLPSGAFDDKCYVENVSNNFGTADAIMDSALPESVKILLITLKKLYIQKGAGRKESALMKGIAPSKRHIIIDILKILKQENFTICIQGDYGPVWLPVKDKVTRARKIVSGSFSDDKSLIDKIKSI